MRRRDFIRITLPVAFAGQAAGQTFGSPDLVFGVIADPQYADVDPAGSRFYRNSLGKLEHAIADLNSRPLEFTVTLGDLIDRDFKSFSAVMPIYEKLKSLHHPVLGNHDFSVDDSEKGNVLSALGMAAPYHSKVVKGWRFLFTDGTESAIWRYPAEDPRAASAQEPYLNSGMGLAQLEWLEKELTAAKEAGQRVIVFNHYPAFPDNGPNIANSRDIVALIGRFEHVAAYMNGHHHAGNYAKSGNCHYVNFKGMVETESKTAYATVTCFPDRLEIEGFGLEPDRGLPHGQP